MNRRHNTDLAARQVACRAVSLAHDVSGLKATKAEERFVDDGTIQTFTVAQIASMWQYSTDTIQRMFAEEPGVEVKGAKNPRGKRKRVTLRIPRAVMDRVKKRLSNR